MPFFDAAEEGTDRLSSLVTNLLDMNRLQTGAVKPFERAVVLEEVVQRAVPEFLKNALSARSVRIFLWFTPTRYCLSASLANIVRERRAPGCLRRSCSNCCRGNFEPVRHVDIRIVDQGPGSACRAA